MALKNAHFILLFLALFVVVAGIEGAINKDESFLAMFRKDCTRFFESLTIPKSTCDHRLEIRNYAFKTNKEDNLELQRENRDIFLSADVKECDDFKLGFCQIKAIESYLTKESEMGKRIDKLEQKLDIVLRRMRAFSDESETKN